MKAWKLWLVAVVMAAAMAALMLKPRLRPHERQAGAPQRIVSLAPNVTEFLFALGVGDRIVGATDFCDYPPEAKAIPRVGGLGAPSLEKLLALAPDLVIAADFEQNEMADVLRAAGVEVIEQRINNFDELFAAVRRIGAAVDRENEAERVAGEMAEQLRLAKSLAEARIAQGHPVPRVFGEVWSDPLMTVGGGSFVDKVIVAAGGVNVAHGLKLEYPTINPEQVIEWDPDVIVFLYMLPPYKAAAELADRIGWKQIKAVRDGRLISDLSPDLLLRPGPRLPQGVRILAERLAHVEN